MKAEGAALLCTLSPRKASPARRCSAESSHGDKPQSDFLHSLRLRCAQPKETVSGKLSFCFLIHFNSFHQASSNLRSAVLSPSAASPPCPPVWACGLPALAKSSAHGSGNLFNGECRPRPRMLQPLNSQHKATSPSSSTVRSVRRPCISGESIKTSAFTREIDVLLKKTCLPLSV